MRRLLAVFAALGLASSAYAADLPMKAPPRIAAAPSGWNGFYVGAQLGYEWSKSNWNTTCIDAGGLPLGGCGSPLSQIIFPGAPDSAASFHTSGTRYGFYGGWMTTAYERYVFGVEADYAFHKRIGTVPFIVGCSTAACSGGANGPGPFFGDSTSLKTRDDYSFRLRAGYLVMPELQIYATGGLASQRVWAQQVCSPTGAVFCFAPVGPFPVISTSTEQLYGYTVGGGLEWKVWNNILVRGEYRYNDYGTWKQAAFIQSGQVEEFADVHVKSQLLTFGIAYLFAPPR